MTEKFNRALWRLIPHKHLRYPIYIKFHKAEDDAYDTFTAHCSKCGKLLKTYAANDFSFFVTGLVLQDEIPQPPSGTEPTENRL